ncbi:MAG: hypothetical protein GC159_05550 [Phycisphaera sp.]|nr:hypothetical protein [Phycisphaera sp.]
MAGLIWWVQLVHYPLFANVGRDAFGAYHARHMHRATWAVGPGMLVELVTAFTLLAMATAPAVQLLTITGAILVVVIWLSTWLVQVPLHDALTVSGDAAMVASLVRGNWVRTIAWTARVPIAAALVMLA